MPRAATPCYMSRYYELMMLILLRFRRCRYYFFFLSLPPRYRRDDFFRLLFRYATLRLMSAMLDTVVVSAYATPAMMP